MYNGGYTQAKMGLAAKNLHRSKEKSCGYYMRVVLFFSSLIQSLIIVSLVLLLVYGGSQQTVEEKRIKELEQRYGNLSLENIALRAKEKNLTNQLNITLTAKKLSDKDLISLRRLANTSTLTINNLRTKWTQCELEKKNIISGPRIPCSPSGSDKYLEHRLRQGEELQKLLRANFTEQMHLMKFELDNAQKDRIKFQLEGIELRRDKAFLEERLEKYEQTCKRDFIQSLEGIPNVTKEFLKRVDDLFSKHISFQLTCDKQSIQLENIRANCSSLSTEVENKLQAYLDKVGSQVTKTVGENARCTTENKRLKEDASWCYQNRTDIIQENKRVLKQTQQNYDKEVERLLLDVTKQTGKKNLLENLVSVKDIEIGMLTESVKDLNASLTICKFGQHPGGASNPFMTPFGQSKFGSSRTGQSTFFDGRSGQSTFGAGSLGSTGMGSMGSTFGTGLGLSAQGTSLFGRTSGSSAGSSGLGLGSAGIGMQKSDSASALTPGSSGTGLSLTGLGQPGAGWPSIGSTGTGVTGLGSTGSGTAGLGSSFGSSGIGSGRTGLSSTGFGSTGSSGAGLGGAGSSGSALTRTGIGGTGLGSASSIPAGASPFGGGRPTGGSDVLTAQINQHLKELHQYAKTD